MKKLLAIGLVCAFRAANADTDLYWRGATV